MPKDNSKFGNLNESNFLPDPKGVKNMCSSKSYHKEINDFVNQAVEKAKFEALKTVLDKLKSELIEKLIAIFDEKGKQKIIYVNDIIIDKDAISKDDSIFLIEKYEDADGKVQERKLKFGYNNSKTANVFDVGNFLDFFENNYIDKFIQFNGKSITGGSENVFRKQVVKIGISNDTSQDYVLVGCDDNTKLILMYDKPIKLINPAIKELDPFSEESWEN